MRTFHGKKNTHTHRDLISPPVNVIAVISHSTEEEDFHFNVTFAYFVLLPLLFIFGCLVLLALWKFFFYF